LPFEVANSLREPAEEKKLTGRERIGDVIAFNASRFGDKIAFTTPGGTGVSFAAFEARVQCFAAALAALGLKPDAIIAILARNRPEYAEVYSASAFGHVIAPLNSRLTPAELETILLRVEPDVVVADATFAPLLDGLRPRLDGVRAYVHLDTPGPGWLSYETLLAGADPSCVTTENVESNQTACVFFTSGTTGTPKGVELSHQGLLANARMSSEVMLDLTPADVTLSCMPMFHVGGMWYHLFPSYLAGATTLIMPEFSATAILKTLVEHRITNTHLAPTMLHDLLAAPDAGAADLSWLRVILYGASSISVGLLRQAMDRLGQCGFVQGYGSTEAGQIAFLSVEDHRAAVTDPNRERLLRSCGRPLPGVQMRIDPAAPEGEPGEIQIRSKNSMTRYWRDPVATAESRLGEWLLTGDLGRLDTEGYCYIADRKRDMIVSGGENVFPQEVEAALSRHPAVSEVAVFDVPDARWVQKVVAAVVLRVGHEAIVPGALVEEARRELAGYKCPKQVFFVDALPKNAAGKVLRRVLRDQFGAL
jgi:long-chain acyl-CoA synthetase